MPSLYGPRGLTAGTTEWYDVITWPCERRMEWEERAAIYEYLGQFDRRESEQRAFADCHDPDHTTMCGR